MNEHDYKVHRPEGNIREIDSGVDSDGKKWGYSHGTVETVYGIVRVWTDFRKDRYKHSRLEIIRNGRQYVRTFGKGYSRRGLVTKAAQFAHDVYAGVIDAEEPWKNEIGAILYLILDYEFGGDLKLLENRIGASISDEMRDALIAEYTLRGEKPDWRDRG